MSAPAVDHDVDLDEQTRAELQPPCDVVIPQRCDQAAAWVCIVREPHACLLGQQALFCHNHSELFGRRTGLLRCVFCFAPVPVRWERL